MPDTEPLVPAAEALMADLEPFDHGLLIMESRDDFRARLLEVQAQAAERAVKPWREALADLSGALYGNAYGPAITPALEAARRLLSPTGGDTDG